MMPTIDYIRVCKLDDAVVRRYSDWQQSEAAAKERFVDLSTQWGWL
ncbi:MULTISPECIES: hypothetical protein [Rhodococcus]|nr:MULTISPECIES: hypothetical protein [Rhodococcus]MBO8150786.1 hypothetical protein [Rhodococcus erythropolis]